MTAKQSLLSEPSVSEKLQRFWSPEVRSLQPYVPGEQPVIAKRFSEIAHAASLCPSAVSMPHPKRGPSTEKH